MGNGVNVGAVWHVLREHVRRDEDVLKRTEAGRRILDAVLTAPLSPDEILAKMHRRPEACAPGTGQTACADYGSQRVGR